MRAKDMISDFVNFIFLFAISLFVFFYFVLGNRLDIAQKIVIACMYFSVFGLIFVLNSKVVKNRKKKFDHEDRLDEIAVFLSNKDKFKDILVIGSLPAILAFIAIFNGTFNQGDSAQAIGIFSFEFTWHCYNFRYKDLSARLRYVTNWEILKDSTVTTLLPILIISISFLVGGADTIDIIQATAVFSIMYGWHKYLFRHRES